jgi:hypothetical protein
MPKPQSCSAETTAALGSLRREMPPFMRTRMPHEESRLRTKEWIFLRLAKTLERLHFPPHPCDCPALPGGGRF